MRTGTDEPDSNKGCTHMKLFILDEFNSRTEYNVLTLYFSAESVSINHMKDGVFIIPGVILNKLTENQLNKIFDWLTLKNNQMIILPALNKLDIGNLFRSTVPIKIVSIQLKTIDHIPVQYGIETNVRNVIFKDAEKILGIHYRWHTGSGTLTICTLPLLDYKLGSDESIVHKVQKYLNALILEQAQDKEETTSVINDCFKLDEIDQKILLLNAAGIIDFTRLKEALTIYFSINIEMKKLKNRCLQLEKHQFVSDKHIRSKTIAFLKEKKLVSFLDVIKEQEEKNNDWR